jgi:hypothetical protein
VNELSSDARSLLQRVRETHEPSRAERERVRAALAIRLAAGAALSTSTAAAGGASAGATSLKALGLAKALLSGLVLGSLGMGVVTLARERIDESRATAVGAAAQSTRAPTALYRVSAPRASRNVVEMSPPAAAASVNRTTPSPSGTAAGETQRVFAVRSGATSSAAEPARRDAIAPSSVGAFAEPPAVTVPSERPKLQASSDSQTLAAEARALAQAQRALDDGAPAKALELLSRHERRFADGMLGQERAAARIFALCALGRHAEAKRESVRFLAAAPQSPLAARVQTACDSSKPSP